ncbi:hypothetical protein ACFFRR_001341 [Megaselia abdita]
MISMGITQSDIVGIMATNTSYVMTVSFAAFFIGTPFQAIDISLEKESVLHLWNITKPKLIFCDGAIYKVVSEVVNELDLQCNIFTLSNHQTGVENIETILKIETTEVSTFKPFAISDLDATAALCCSSGSSGPSKVVCWSHRFIKRYCLPLLNGSSSDIILNAFSLYWSVGIREYISAALNEATLVVPYKFDAKEMLSLIEKYQVTKCLLVPVHIAQMLSCQEIHTINLSSMKIIQSTGAKLTIDLKNRLRQFLPPSCIIKSTYGCSEMAGMAYEHQDSLFILHPNIEAKILCLNTNKEQNTDEEGEIAIRHKTSWCGYYNDEKATRQVYKDGWYRTGDLGHFDSNKYLHIKSRIKDIIRLELFDISPLEIESEIMKMTEVVLVVVVGIPDELKWNRLAALVVKRPDSKITAVDIQNHVASRKPEYKHLNGGVYFVESVPTTATGKVSRRLATERGIELYNGKQNDTN